MNILVATGLYPPEGGGPATYAKALHDELPKLGVSVTVLPFSQVRRYPKFIRHIVYFFLCLKYGKKVDVIYALDPVSVGLPAMLSSFFLRKKFILKMVGDYAWEQGMQRFGVADLLDEFVKKRYGLSISLLRFIQGLVAKRAAIVVVPSAYLKKIVCTWGVKKEKIHVIYNAAPDVSSVGHKKVLRGLLKYHGKYIVTVARLVPWKGIRSLIDAVGALEKSGIEARLLVIGDGPERDALEEYALEHTKEKTVSFTGRLPNDITLAYIKAADVLALNTGYEGFSHLLLEAQALGTPTVTTSVGGNPEIITHGRNGLLVPYKDTDALRKALTRALTDEVFRRNSAAAGKRKADKFSKDRMIQETKELLETL
ncbi:MAG: glycosyltransferase family 4 protein [Patescibacteria group bacterium UBA2103]